MRIYLIPANFIAIRFETTELTETVVPNNKKNQMTSSGAGPMRPVPELKCTTTTTTTMSSRPYCSRSNTTVETVLGTEVSAVKGRSVGAIVATIDPCICPIAVEKAL